MKTLLILGAGTASTQLANRLIKQLDPQEWKIIVVDRDERHYYQPGFLFVPFGIYQPEGVVKPKKNLIARGVEVVFAEIELVEPEANRVRLAKDQRVIQYDYLVVATGCDIAPEETPGLKDAGWRQNIFDFYTYAGSVALAQHLKRWKGGRLVVNIAETPIKCPVAPLEFVCLADWFFHEQGLRDKVELVYVTPLSGAFTKPKASAVLGRLLEAKHVEVVADFALSEVDNGKQVIRSYDDREVRYDLLVSVPVNKGAEVFARSGMGNELNYVPMDKHTLQSKQWPNVWVIGDAGDAPTSKAGSVVHFEGEILAENLLRHMHGLEPLPKFDGHANCFVESGYGKAFLIDFNYDTEPLPGTFPLPGVGPLPLLEESPLNHWAKMMFRWIYWNMFLPGAELPFPNQMSLAGKQR